MSKITPEDRTPRPIAQPVMRAPELLRGHKPHDAGRLAQREPQADEADEAAQKRARLAKTTGKMPPDRSGLDTEPQPADTRAAGAARAGARARDAHTDEVDSKALEPKTDEVAKRQAEDAARMAEAQRLIIKVP